MKNGTTSQDAGITRSGARRFGDDYQDILAGKLFIEWLRSPWKYKYVILENRKAGSLDDITALTQKDNWILIQSKSTTNVAAHLLTFDVLLKKESGEQSLLEKWAASVRKYPPEQLERVLLETNWVPDDSFRNNLDSQKHISLQAVDPSIRKRIFEQVGEEDAQYLFAKIEFVTGLPDREHLSEQSRETLRELNPSRPGSWDSLLKSIDNWITSPASLPSGHGRIQLSDVRKACQWHKLHEINETFPLPDDMVSFEDSISPDALLAELDRHDRVIEVQGPPGSGKSTLTTWLGNEYKREGNVVLYHHYFISNNDTTQHRYTALVALESLMYQLEEHNLLGENVDTGSPDPEINGKARFWLESSAAAVKKNGKRLIVIVDGLDHVYHDSVSRAKEYLQDLFEVLLPVPEGMFLLIATQPIPEANIPEVLNARAASRKKVQMPQLSVSAMSRWLKEHGHELLGADQRIIGSEWSCEGLAGKIIKISDGLPLGFRLLQHQVRLSGIAPTQYSLEKLPHIVATDIKKYYSEMWRRLDRPAQKMLCLIVRYRWPWSLQNITDCMVSAGYERSTADAAIDSIQVLLTERTGPFTVFHTSLAWFVEEQPFYISGVAETQRIVLQWLRKTAPGVYQLSRLWIVEADAGQDDDLLKKPDRNWVISSLEHHVPWHVIESLLYRSAKLALARKRFDLFAQRLILLNYVKNIFSYYDESQDTMGILLTRHLGEYGADLANELLGEVGNLYDSEVHTLFEYFHANREETEAEKCFVEMQKRIERDANNTEHYEQMAKRFSLYVDMSITKNPDDIKRLFKLILLNRSGKKSALVASNIGKTMLRHGNVGLAHEFLTESKEALEQEEMNACFPWLYALLAQQSSFLPSDVSKNVLAMLPWPNLLLLFTKAPVGTMPSPVVEQVAASTLFKADVSEFHENKRCDRIVDVFFRFVVDIASNHQNAIDQFCSSLDQDEWLLAFVQLLRRGAENFCSEIVTGISATSLFDIFAEQDALFGNAYDENFYLRVDCRKALTGILFLSSLFLSSTQREAAQHEISRAVESRRIEAFPLIQLIVDLNCIDIWKQSAAQLSELCKEQLQIDRIGFIGCARELAFCSEFLRSSGFDGTDLAHASCEYLIGYENHKDLLLYDILQGAGALSPVDSKESCRVLKRAAPVALGALLFTDGDETSDLASTFGSVVKTACPQNLLLYYNWLQSNERYGDATSVYSYWLETASLNDKLEKSLAKTAYDDTAIRALMQHSKDREGARDTLNDIEKRLGGLNGYLGEPAKDGSNKSSEKTVESSSSIDVSKYDPENLNALLDDSRGGYTPDIDGTMARWLEYWQNNGKGTEAANILTKQAENGYGPRIGFHTYKAMRSLLGSNEAFQWLVNANQGISGWLFYSRDERKSIELWREVKESYHDRWCEFISKTLFNSDLDGLAGARDILPRLTKYLLFQGETKAAEDLLDGASTLLIQLVPSYISLDLPHADWMEAL